MGPSRSREKASREAGERSTEEEVRSDLMKGPENHSKDHGFYSDRKQLLEGLEETEDMLSLRFSTRINLSTIY